LLNLFTGNRQPVPVEPQRALSPIPDNARPYHNYRILTDRLINQEYFQQILNVLYDDAFEAEITRDIKYAENHIEFQSTIADGELFANVLIQYDAGLHIVPGEQNVRLQYRGNIEIERVENVAALEDDILHHLRTQNSIDTTRTFVAFREEEDAEHNLSIIIDVPSAGRIEELGRRIRLFEDYVDLAIVD